MPNSSVATITNLASPRFGDRLETLVQCYYETVLQPGDHAIDGGAHSGHHVFPMASAVGPTGKVVAIEPLDAALEILRANRTKHGFDNVEVVQGALTLTPGVVKFVEIGGMSGYSGLRETPWVPADLTRTEVSVTGYTLDQIGAPLDRLTVIKLDLEGGDYDAIRGGMQIIRARQPAIIFECGGDHTGRIYDYGYNDFAGLLDQLGYAFYDLVGRPMTEARWAAIPTETPPEAFAAPKGSRAEKRMLDAVQPAIARALEMYP